MSSSDAGIDEDVGVEPPRSRRATVLKIVFGLAVLVFAVIYVASRWSKVRAALEQTSPGWVVLAFVFAAAGQWAGALAFRATLTASSRALPMPDVARVYFVSQLGKYIPGSVWPIVAVQEMGRRYGITRRAATVAGVLALVFTVLMGALVGAVLLLIGVARDASGLWWLALFIPAAVFLLQPRVITAIVDRVLRLTRREPVELRLRGRVLVAALGWPVVSWLLLGLQCWALVVALGGPVLGSLAASIGGFALAYTAGTVVVPVPGGAGVREAVLGYALVEVIKQSSSFDHSQVLVVVLLSRMLLIVLDFGQAGLATVVNRRRPPRPVAPIPSAPRSIQ